MTKQTTRVVVVVNVVEEGRVDGSEGGGYRRGEGDVRREKTKAHRCV